MSRPKKNKGSRSSKKKRKKKQQAAQQRDKSTPTENPNSSPQIEQNQKSPEGHRDRKDDQDRSNNFLSRGKDFIKGHGRIFKALGGAVSLVAAIVAAWFTVAQFNLSVRQEQRQIARSGARMVFQKAAALITGPEMTLMLTFRNYGDGIAKDAIFQLEGQVLKSQRPGIDDVRIDNCQHLGGVADVGPGDTFDVGIPSIRMPAEYARPVARGEYRLQFAGYLEYTYTDDGGRRHKDTAPVCQKFIPEVFRWVSCLEASTPEQDENDIAQ